MIILATRSVEILPGLVKVTAGSCVRLLPPTAQASSPSTVIARVFSLNELLYAILDRIPEPNLSYIRSDRRRLRLSMRALFGRERLRLRSTWRILQEIKR